MAQWVQHISGQGQQWEVMHSGATYWNVPVPGDRNTWYSVPKSEYVLCAPPVPPERWEDVTAACRWKDGRLYHETVEDGGYVVFGHDYQLYDGYRLRSVIIAEQWAFVVEKKVQP